LDRTAAADHVRTDRVLPGPDAVFVAIKLLPVGIALLFEYMAPLLVALWARFGQRQKVKTRLWYGLGLSLFGLACVAEVWKGSLALNGWGVAAGLSAAVLLCFYYVLGARGVTQRDTISLTFWAFGVSGLAGLITSMFRVHDVFPFAVFSHTSHGVPVWALAIYLVVCRSIASYLLVAAAIRHLPATSVGIIGMVEPVIASGVAWVILDERLRRPARRRSPRADRSRRGGSRPSHGTRRNCRAATWLTRQDRAHA
jgi:drug/metabolite transporter (DMT)-like permease